MKDELHGQQFPSYDAAVRAVKMWATSASADFLRAWHAGSCSSLVKVHASGGDYVEK